MSTKSLWAVIAGIAVSALVLVPSSLPASDPEAANQAADSAFDLAVSYAGAHPAALGVGSADVLDLYATSTVKSATGGLTHVNLNQRYQGLEVFGGNATVSLDRDGRVVFAAGAFVRDLGVGASGTLSLDAAQAVEAAAAALDLAEPENLRVLESNGGDAQETVLSGAGISEVPIPARLGWQPTSSGLRLAWQLSIDDVTGASLWNASVDAATGALLDVDDWTSHDNVADLQATLSRSGGQAPPPPSYSPPGTMSPVDDGSSYRVIQLPKESPNDGPFTVVTNPADSFSSPFGWHDTDGAPGPEFTVTRGNNAHAYMDQDDNESEDFGTSPDGTAGLDFLFTADLTEHAQDYRDAAVTNLFYWNNTFHDVLKRYGFDEAADNFQAINYSGVGSNGDYVRAEAADGSGTNNANFSTPSAGGSPRMQMYLWPGNQLGAQNQLVVDGLGTFDAGWSRFGPPAKNAGLSGALVLANDATGTTSDACSPLVGFPAGAIAVIDRSASCNYLTQVTNAQAAGAAAVVIANNTGGNAPILSGSMTAPPPVIPAVSVTQADGATIKVALPGTGVVRKNPAHTGIRDGDLDAGIVIHEYGHGVSNRLTGGPGINCLSGNEQMGEGWSDYLAITMTMDTAIDDPDLPRGMGPYALFQPDRHGNGIRPRPYTRDMSIQPFTYDSIKTGGWLNGTSLALPHGLGHGWAATLWDLDWDLIDKHGFNPNIYDAWNTGGNNRAFQYVIEGMKLQGCGPGLVVGSRAIVTAADVLSGGEDTCTVWATFARRGLGYSAVQGTTNRNDNDEAFDTDPACREDFTAGADAPYGTLNSVKADSVVVLKFRADEFEDAEDVPADNSPYSRKVDCTTLRVVSQDPSFITPRELPIAAETQGRTRLAKLGGGQFRYRWDTEKSWAGTCREFVLTRMDGVQHRAFFSFR